MNDDVFPQFMYDRPIDALKSINELISEHLCPVLDDLLDVLLEPSLIMYYFIRDIVHSNHVIFKSHLFFSKVPEQQYKNLNKRIFLNRRRQKKKLQKDISREKEH